MTMFTDRRDAGRRLAALLLAYAGKSAVVVAMPRGGLPVAEVIADRLAAPLDVIVVRKLGCPWQPELGIGAIAEADVSVLNEGLISELGVSPHALAEVTARERAELERRVARYRRDRPPTALEGRPAILVDDGLATGYTARAAVAALRNRGASRVILAVPVGPADTLELMRSVADEVVAVARPPWFFAIGDFYDDFGQTTDDEVTTILAQHQAHLAATVH